MTLAYIALALLLTIAFVLTGLFAWIAYDLRRDGIGRALNDGIEAFARMLR